jgi:hypothetical protein
VERGGGKHSGLSRWADLSRGMLKGGPKAMCAEARIAGRYGEEVSYREATEAAMSKAAEEPIL